MRPAAVSWWLFALLQLAASKQFFKDQPQGQTVRVTLEAWDIDTVIDKLYTQIGNVDRLHRIIEHLAALF